MDAEKIALCPICGSDDIVIDDSGCWTVCCGNCEATLDEDVHSYRDAVEKWNKFSRQEWEKNRKTRQLYWG